MLYCLAAFRRQQAGDSRWAARFHMRAVELAPNDPNILTAAGDCLRFTGQLQQAVDLFDRSLGMDPMQTAAWYGRATALEAMGALEDAAGSFRRVSELAPDTAPGFAGLATTTAQLGNSAQARQYAERAYALSPTDPAAVLALARCEIADRAYANAVSLLRTLVGQPHVPAYDRVMILAMMGDALDLLGHIDEAFEAYSRANAHFAEMHAGPNAPPEALHRVEEIDQALAKLDPGAFGRNPSQGDSPVAGHIFLLGYPRSGTTLVEQILNSLPDVITVEETPTLADSEHYLTASGLAALPDLSDEEVRQLRTAYWRRVEAAGVDPEGKTFVDMDPFKGPALPLIARLFPEAKIVMMRRDPRDVVWSCFRRTFLYSPQTYEFTTLPRTARLYDAMMRLTMNCLERLPIESHTVVYENLVRDFDTITRELCRFAGITWTPDIRNFAETARRGRVKTASAAQVRQKLFDGSGQWRRYADKFEPLITILEPWLTEQRVTATVPNPPDIRSTAAAH